MMLDEAMWVEAQKSDGVRSCVCTRLARAIVCRERRQTEAAAKKAAAQRKREADADQKAAAKKQAQYTEVERARAAEVERVRQAAEALRKQAEQEKVRENIERHKAEQKRRAEAQKENQRPHFTSAANVKPSDANMPGWFQQHTKRQGEKERYDAFLQQMESLKVDTGPPTPWGWKTRSVISLRKPRFQYSTANVLKAPTQRREWLSEGTVVNAPDKSLGHPTPLT